MNMTLRIFAIVLLSTSLLHAQDDPGAKHETAMNTAKERAKGIMKKLVGLVLTTKTKHDEFNKLLQTYNKRSNELRELGRKIRTIRKENPEYAALQSTRKELEKKASATRKTEDKKQIDAMNKALHRNWVDRKKLQKKLLPTETQRHDKLRAELPRLRKQLIGIALTELREHPQLKQKIEALEQAKAKEAVEYAAMLKARGMVTPLEYLVSRNDLYSSRGTHYRHLPDTVGLNPLSFARPLPIGVTPLRLADMSQKRR